MNLVSALSHAVELFIVFQFFNDLFANKGRKTVAAAVGIAFYAVAYAAFLLFNSTVVNILLCFVIDSVFAKLFFECNIKGATLGALFIAVSNTASEFIVISLLAIIGGGDIKAYQSSVYIYLLMVLLSKSVLFVLCLCGTVSARSEGRAHPRVPADLSYSVDSYPLYFLDDFRALRFVEEYKCYNFRRVNRYNRIGVSDFRLLRAHFAQAGRAL